jgi:hypothetical protein
LYGSGAVVAVFVAAGGADAVGAGFFALLAAGAVGFAAATAAVVASFVRVAVGGSLVALVLAEADAVALSAAALDADSRGFVACSLGSLSFDFELSEDAAAVVVGSPPPRAKRNAPPPSTRTASAATAISGALLLATTPFAIAESPPDVVAPLTPAVVESIGAGANGTLACGPVARCALGIGAPPCAADTPAMRSIDNRDRGAAKGASAWASSDTFAKRALRSFSRHRPITRSSPTGTSGRKVRTLGAGAIMT